MDFKKKLGPLPLWAWVLIVGVAGGLIWYEHDKSGTTASSTTGSNSVDPATGLTYAQEAQEEQQGIDPYTGESYAMENGGAGGTSSGADTGGGSYPGSTGLTDPTDTSLTGFLNTYEQMVQAGLISPPQSQAAAPAPALPAPAPAAAEQPMIFVSVPASTPAPLSAVTAPATVAAAATPPPAPRPVSTNKQPPKPPSRNTTGNSKGYAHPPRPKPKTGTPFGGFRP